MEPDQTPVEIAPIPPYAYPPASPIVDRVVPEQPKRKPELVQPFQRPPTRPVAPEHPLVTMSHPETVTLPPTQDVVRQPEPSNSSTPEPSKVLTPVKEKPLTHVQKSMPPTTSTSGSKLEEKPSIQRKKPPKSEEKASEPGSKNKKGRKFNGGGGRIHTEAHIDRILDEFILTGKLPSYVSERQRYDYRHHIRLPERRQLLGKQQAGNKTSGTSTTTGTKDNITHFPGTGTHDS